MNLKELKEVIEIFTSRESIEELEIEKAGVRVRMKRTGSPAAAAPALASAASAPAAPIVHLQSAPPVLQAAAPVEAVADDLFYVKSPMVGTFYRASAPTEKAFVSVGDHVEKGSVLCIVEAMKLMNEIESEIAGEIIATLMENGHPVEYGQRLFAIRPR